YAGPQPGVSHPAPGPGHHARRMGRVKSVAGTDGPLDRRRPRDGRRARVPRRCRRRCRAHRTRRGGARVSLLPRGGRAHRPARHRHEELREMTASLDRRPAPARMLRDRGDALVVTGLGNPTYDVAAAGDVPLNFYFWAAMGGASMAGLGLALAQPRRRVLVVTGDGERDRK